MAVLLYEKLVSSHSRMTRLWKSVVYSTVRYCSRTENPVRVRFAPSPTGQLHLGGLRTALYNYLFAKSHQGKFILRIEDTDRSRFVPGAAERIYEMLDWSGLRPDEGPVHGGEFGPYYQSQRVHLYRDKVQLLMDLGQAYRCFCSEKRLDLIRREAKRLGQIPKYDNKCRHLTQEDVDGKLAANLPHTIRFKLDSGEESWKDLVHGHVRQNVAAVEGDPIIIKSDGYPTYHLACVVDDHLMEISHVLRGEEWLASTGKHILLHRAFGWSPPDYAHLPLLLNTDGTKLSKRQSDIGVEYLKDCGYYPEAVINLLTKAGSGFRCRDTVGMNLRDLVQNFQLNRLSPSSGRLQLEQLDTINRLHLKQKLLSNESDVADKLSKLIGDSDSHYRAMSDHDRTRFLERALEWGQNRINKVEDFLQPSFRFLWFIPTIDSDWLKELDIDQSQVILQTIDRIESIDDVLVQTVSPVLRSVAGENGYKMSDFMKVLRMALCGLKSGPPVAEVINLLGQEEVLKRLNIFYKITQSLK